MERCEYTELPVDTCACKKHRPDLVEEPETELDIMSMFNTYVRNLKS